MPFDRLPQKRDSSIRDPTGTVRARYDYDPYGKRSENLITTNAQKADFAYTGHFYLEKADTYLTYFRAYNPNTGRWLSRDPIAEGGGVNLYAYARNSPIIYWDPNGLDIYHFVNDDNTSHSASLTGNGNDGYDYNSYGSGDGSSGSSGDHLDSKHFDALDEAMNYLRDQGYDRWQRWDTTPEQDEKARREANKWKDKPYNLTANNCWDAVSAQLAAARVTAEDRNFVPSINFNQNEGVADDAGSLNGGNVYPSRRAHRSRRTPRP